MAKYLAVFSGGHVPLCKPDGKFQRVQCHLTECWCVEEETGDELQYTRVQTPAQPDCEGIKVSLYLSPPRPLYTSIPSFPSTSLLSHPLPSHSPTCLYIYTPPYLPSSSSCDIVHVIT